MSYSIWQRDPDLPSQVKVDVAIVGAGLAGLGVAYWLKQYAPALRICLIDREGVAAGASGRNAGFMTAGSTTYLQSQMLKHGPQMAAAHWLFRKRSLALMREHILEKASGIPWRQWSSTTLYQDQAQAQAIFEQISSLKVGNFQLKPMAHWPHGPVGAEVGIIDEQEGCLHPVKTLQRLAEIVRSTGVIELYGQGLSWFENHADGVLLQLDRGQVQASQAILCLNGYAPQLTSFLASKVTAKRAQMLAFTPAGVMPEGNFYDPKARAYFRCDHQGRLLVGGMRLLEEQSENSDFDKVTRGIQTALEEYARKLFPNKLGAVNLRWSGVMGFTASEQPLLLEHPDCQAMTVLGGFSGHGMGMGFGAAESAALRLLKRPYPQEHFES